MSAAPAGPEPRFLAYLVDRAVGWVLAAAVGLLVGAQAGSHHIGAALTGFVLALLVLGALAAVGVGRYGTSPGMAAFGLRVVRRSDGRPIGVRSALLRALVLGVAGLPTLGLGLAALAWTALTDGTGERRGAHDRIGDAIVVEAHESVVERDVEPEDLVNLTALRLLPDPEPAEPAESPEPPSGEPVPVPEQPPGAATWSVDFDTGESFVVEVLTLIGTAPRAEEGQAARQVTLRSSGALAPTHAQLEVTPDGALVVMDRGSAEGSVLVRGGHSRPLTAGRPSTLRDGDTLHLGDRVMRVSRQP